jgi:ribosomal protein S18 acetylase RimI-like enzyme
MSERTSLLPSLDLADRTLATDIAYTISRMKVLERLPGNPIGIDARWIDDKAVALTARLPAFARVVGLRAEHEPQLGPIVEWYRSRGIKPTFEMVPGHFTPGLGRELTQLGFSNTGFHASLIGTPSAIVRTEAGAAVERVATVEVMEDYLAAYVAGWGIAEKDQVQFKANVRPWLEQPGWSLYLARVDGQPAAAATLFLHERVAYLADATTDPAFRNRGLQTALLKRRIRDAGAAGAEIVFSGAAPFSTSHRNMEQVGLKLQFVRALWTSP